MMIPIMAVLMALLNLAVRKDGFRLIVSSKLDHKNTIYNRSQYRVMLRIELHIVYISEDLAAL
jgi:hypothetical protein